MLSLQLKSGEYLTIGDDIVVQVFEQGGQGLQRGAGPDKLQGHFLVGKQGERRLVADH